jgi:LacI family transcriptional regulator
VSGRPRVGRADGGGRYLCSVTERRRRPTLRDIADETGLSPAAVSYALRGLHGTPQTRARVRKAAEQLGYQVDPIARALASGRTGNVGVLCGSLTDPWQQSVAAGLGRALLGTGRNALTIDAGNDPKREAELARRLVDQRVDAVIVLPVDPLAEHWSEVAAEVPVVAVGDGLPEAGTAGEVVFDNATGVADGLRLLAGHGHTRVAVLTPTDRATPDRPAERVVHGVAADLGLTARLHTAPHDLEGAASVAHELLTAADPPTAFFCLADAIAFGVYAAARGLRLVVPGDISVIGYDDQPVSRLLSPPLSSYRWPLAQLVEEVVGCTISATDGGPRGRRTVLVPTPMPRDSVAAPRA